jgi:tRNA (cmo5U34)-methyltransferase
MIAVATREYARRADLLRPRLLAWRFNAQYPPPCTRRNRVIGIDNSPAMVERCRAILAADPCPIPVDIRCADLLECEFDKASLITMNFSLQFVPPAARQRLLGRIATALDPGGCLILSEKIAFDDPHEQQLLQTLHHDFKHMQGYSELEIAQKRAALENVLLPETLDTHRRRLAATGSAGSVWLQCLNFVSLLALK